MESFIRKNIVIISIIGGFSGVIIITYIFIIVFQEKYPVKDEHFFSVKAFKNYLKLNPSIFYMAWFGMLRLSFYCIVFFPLIKFVSSQWARLKSIINSRGNNLAFKLFLALLPLVLLFLVQDGLSLTSDILNKMFGGIWQFKMVSYFGVIISVICYEGLLIVSIIASKTEEFTSFAYKNFVKSSNVFVAILGLAISFSVVWHQLIRLCYLKQHPSAMDYPIEWIIGSALINSLLIAVVYLPIRFQIEYLYFNENRKTMHLDNPSLAEDGFQKKMFSILQPAVAVLSPILSTFIGHLISKI